MLSESLKEIPEEVILLELIKRDKKSKRTCIEVYGSLPCSILTKVEGLSQREIRDKASFTREVHEVDTESLISFLTEMQYPELIINDNRRDFFSFSPEEQRLSLGVAAIICKNKLSKLPSGDFQLDSPMTLLQDGFCSCENYSGQPSISEASAFCISKSHILTAGHNKRSECMDTSFKDDHFIVFDYHIGNFDRAGNLIIHKDCVYEIDSIGPSGLDVTWDYMFLKLNREVEEHRILNISKNRVRVDENIFVLGYPFGLPLKLAGDSKVDSHNSISFSNSLHAFPGNSGSPIFKRGIGEPPVVVGMHLSSNKPSREFTIDNCKVVCFSNEIERTAHDIHAIINHSNFII